METIREIRQRELALKWINSNRKGIINACPRFGKIFISILIMENIKPSSVLIAYPDLKIRKSWEEDFKKWEYYNPNITFTTYTSLWKYKNKLFDLIILDECHLLSENQINTCVELFKENPSILGLTGTLSSWTERVLREDLQLRVIARYSIEQAIEEGILPDYEINVVKVPLDRYVMKYGKKRESEKQLFDKYRWVTNKLESEGKANTAFMMKLKLIRILKDSWAKMQKTIDLIEEFREERLLVFAGSIKIAEELGIPCHHSLSKDKKLWNDFISGKSKHLTVIKMGNTGTTFLPLSKAIINYFDSQEENLTQKVLRAMSLEYDNPKKKSVIYIICSTENIEEIWLSKALAMFDKNKIKYV
jgi:superfamily II DNA or RNA helicase